MSTAWAGGSTRGWRATRDIVLARDGYRCQVKIAGVCTVRATCVHHTKGKGTSEDPLDLQSSCGPCNARVNNPARTSTHLRVVAWVRAQPPPVGIRDMAHQFPNVTNLNLRTILKRAVQRGELITPGRGQYRQGPTGIAPIVLDPAPRPMTRW